MNNQAEQQLLRDYLDHGSEAAFSELVRRHIDLVYSTALRLVCEVHTAEDVTQGVFVELAQNAAKLANHPVLSGWLHCTTRNLAAKSVRSDVRRRVREREVASMNQLLPSDREASWEEIAPHLDAALGELTEPDRDALLLRFFEKKSAQQMAEILGISAEAAQKRVSRAIDRLREVFLKHKVTIGASGLALLLGSNAVQSAPVGLVMAASAAVASSSMSTSTAFAASKFVAMTTLQKTLITLTVAAFGGIGIYEARQGANLRSQNLILQQQQVAPSQPRQKLASEREAASNQFASLQRDDERLAQSLLKQRDPATGSNRGASNAPPAKTGSVRSSSVAQHPTIPLLPATDWKNVGTATPNEALQTLFWAASNQDTNVFIKALVWDETAKAKLEALFAAAPEDIRSKFGSVDGMIFEMAMGGRDTPMTGFGIVSVKVEGDEATLIEEHQYQDGSVRQNPITLHREDDGWHILLDDKRLEKLGAYLSSLASKKG